MDKQQVLNNIENLTAEQLFEYIIQGFVNLRDLMEKGLNHSKRKIIQNLLDEHNKKDEDAWEHCRYGNEAELRDYISKFLKGKHVQEAKEKIDQLEKVRATAQKIKNEVLTNIRKNLNSYTPGMINEYLSNGTITKDDLHQCGIPNHIIDNLEKIVLPVLNLGEKPDSLPDGFTEVYFWGIPGSGKTCALAALLSTAEKKGYLEIATGPGYDYMTLLKNIFINEKAILPSSTLTETTQYLPFVLRENSDQPRSVSLIELSGEIFQCFYYLNAGKKFPSDEHKSTFDTLNKFLSGKNKKIHFFFIDFNQRNIKDSFGYTQVDYLSAASIYFKNKEIFKESTIAIYVVVTKSDLMPCDKEMRETYAKNHLINNNFSAFMNTLKDKCKRYSINAGTLEIVPFSLGKVYFQYICEFDKASAERIIEILFNRIRHQKDSILNWFNK